MTNVTFRSKDIAQRLKGYDRLFLSTCLLIVATLIALDIILLERKYEIFADGFLQSHRIAGFGNIFLFACALILAEVFFCFAVAGIWAAALAKFRTRRTLAAYHFLFLFGGFNVAVIAIRYQLLSYFSDYLDFALVRNLAGGSLAEAIAYGFDEGILFGVIAAILALTYIAGHWLLARGTICREMKESLSGRPSIYLRTTLLSSLGMSVLILTVNQNEDYRHHLNRTTAYSYCLKLLDSMTDIDGDGYGLFAWWPDPSPFDSTIYPNALDVPGDGIDQNSLMGDFVYVPSVEVRVDFAERKEHLIVVVIESARADVLSALVAGIPVTPTLRSMAESGISASKYYSHTGYTTTSIKAMFSGSLTGHSSFGTSLFTLLKQHGYQVAVISGQDESFGGMAEALQMKESSVEFFDATHARAERVFTSGAATSLTLSNDRVLTQLKAVMNRMDWKRPVFLYVNFQSAHFPYHHPGMPTILNGVTPLSRSDIGRSSRAELMLTYLNAIAYADASVKELIFELRKRNIYDSTLLVVTGDHGESLFDDGLLGHGHQLNDFQTRTLLVANRNLRQFADLLGQVDLPLALLSGVGARFTSQDGVQRLDLPQVKDEVFQYIGPIHRPNAIGFVDSMGRRVTFNVSTRETYFDTLGRWVSLKEVRKYPSEAGKLSALVREWERARWESHLSDK